jgi:glycosyltransferase involved in cell wall biosynthesis
MKILQVIPYFVPAWDFGGPLPVCYQLSKQLVRRGHEVAVWTTDALNARNRIAQPEETIDGIQVRRFRNVSNSFAYRYNISSPIGMALSAGGVKAYDIIHIHEYRVLQNAFVRGQAKRHGVPYVVQAHGSLTTFFQKGRLKRIFDRLWGYRILRDAAKVIALTQTEAGQYKSMGVSDDKIEIVPNGIDLSEFQDLPPKGEFRREHGLADSERIVLYLGRIHQTKGIDLLVRAFVGLSKEAGDARLVIVGPDDGYLPALKSLIGELHIEEKVLLTGPVYGRDKLAAYVDADVFVTPSFYGFPVTFMEACATGTPIVTTERWDHLDWLDGRVGYVTHYDETELTKAIAAVLDNRDLAEQFGANGRQIVRDRFNWASIAEQLERIYAGAQKGGAA